jgi:hypothetical protein
MTSIPHNDDLILNPQAESHSALESEASESEMAKLDDSRECPIQLFMTMCHRYLKRVQLESTKTML